MKLPNVDIRSENLDDCLLDVPNGTKETWIRGPKDFSMKAYDPGTVEVTANVAKMIKAMFRDRLETVDNKCIDISMGEEVRRTGLENGAAFFRIDVKQSDMEKGFFFFCRNNARDTLKLVLFNADGDKVHVHSPNRAWSQGAMYFTAFEIYKVPGAGGFARRDSKTSKGAFSTITISEDHKDPALEALSALDNMSSSKGTVSTGKHLLCVLGSHRIRDAAFTLSAVPAKLSDMVPVQKLQEADKALLDLRFTLQASKSEYQQVKGAYLACLDRVAEEEGRLRSLLGEKNLCYENFVDACLKESNLPARTTPLPQLKPQPSVQAQRPPAQSSALSSAGQPAAATRGKEIIMARYIYFDNDDDEEEFNATQQQDQESAAVTEHTQSLPAATAQTSTSVVSTGVPTAVQHVATVSIATAPTAPVATASGASGKSMMRIIYTDEDDDVDASPSAAPSTQFVAPAPVVQPAAPVSHAAPISALASVSAAPVASVVHTLTPAAATASTTLTKTTGPSVSPAPVSVPGSSGSKSLCRFIYADEEDDETSPAAVESTAPTGPSTAESVDASSFKASVQGDCEAVVPAETSPAKHVHWPEQVDADQIEIAAREEQHDTCSEGGPVLSVFHPTEMPANAVLEELSPGSSFPLAVSVPAEESVQVRDTDASPLSPQGEDVVVVEEETEAVQPVQLASAFADAEEHLAQRNPHDPSKPAAEECVLLQTVEERVAEQPADKVAIDGLVALTVTDSLMMTEAAEEIAADESAAQVPAPEAATQQEISVGESKEEPVLADFVAAVNEAPQQPVNPDPVSLSVAAAFSLVAPAPPAPVDTSSKVSKKKKKNKKKKKGGSTPVEDDTNCDNEPQTPQLEDGETDTSPVPEPSSVGQLAESGPPQEPAIAEATPATITAAAVPQEIEEERAVFGAAEEGVVIGVVEEERAVIGAAEEERAVIGAAEEERAGEATSLDDTLNNSADFADALDGLPASVLASKTGAASAGAEKMVWKVHPEAVGQQPVPMVWNLPASADTAVEPMIAGKATPAAAAVVGGESKQDSNGHSSSAKESVRTAADTKVPASTKIEATKPSTSIQQQSASLLPAAAPKRPADPAATARALAAMNAFTDSVKPKAATTPTPPLSQQARSFPVSSPQGVASLASHSNGSAGSNTVKAPTWNFAPPVADSWDFTPSTSSAQPQVSSSDASFTPTSSSAWNSPSATLQPSRTTPSSGGMPQMARGYSSSSNTSPMQWGGTPPMRPLSSAQIRTGAAGLPGAAPAPAAQIVHANKKYLDMSDPFAGL